MTRARLLLARMWEDDGPGVIVAAIDQSIWDHWDDDEEAAWVAAGQRAYGLDPSDCEWKQAWAEFNDAALEAAFVTVTVQARVSDGVA